MPVRQKVADPPKKTYVNKEGKRKNKKPETYEKQYYEWVAKERSKDDQYVKAFENYLTALEAYKKNHGEPMTLAGLQGYQPLDLSNVTSKADLKRMLNNR
jgi:hypothetical protein